MWELRDFRNRRKCAPTLLPGAGLSAERAELPDPAQCALDTSASCSAAAALPPRALHWATSAARTSARSGPRCAVRGTVWNPQHRTWLWRTCIAHCPIAYCSPALHLLLCARDRFAILNVHFCNAGKYCGLEGGPMETFAGAVATFQVSAFDRCV